MQLIRSHRFAAPLEAVVASLFDPAYAQHLAQGHSFFQEIELLSQRERGGVVERAVRYRARPFIARLGMFALPESWFTWTEHARYERASGLFHFDNVPEVESVRGRLINRGSMQFRASLDEQGLEQCVREAQFEVGFSVPSLYRALSELALGMVGRELERSLDEEAALLQGWLAGARQKAA